MPSGSPGSYPTPAGQDPGWGEPASWAETQPSYVAPPPPPRRPRRPRRSLPVLRIRLSGCSCGCLSVLLLASLLLGAYFLAPFRTNILLIGIDYTDPSNAVARSDTIILTTFLPFEPYTGMLSVPRDLWVSIPGVGENRINTAHFFAEANQAGSGPEALLQTVRQNFGVEVDYYVRIRFEGFREIVDAMGGVDITLSEPMAGYEAGQHHLTGRKALAFARNRAGSDDFFRMEHGQVMLKALTKQMSNPLKWVHLPRVYLALSRNLDTNVPTWMWPRLGMALLRLGPDGIDNRTISREMVQPVLTDQGANVLIPDWGRINPVLLEMFGQ